MKHSNYKFEHMMFLLDLSNNLLLYYRKFKVMFLCKYLERKTYYILMKIIISLSVYGKIYPYQ